MPCIHWLRHRANPTVYLFRSINHNRLINLRFHYKYSSSSSNIFHSRCRSLFTYISLSPLLSPRSGSSPSGFFRFFPQIRSVSLRAFRLWNFAVSFLVGIFIFRRLRLVFAVDLRSFGDRTLLEVSLVPAFFGVWIRGDFCGFIQAVTNEFGSAPSLFSMVYFRFEVSKR